MINLSPFEIVLFLLIIITIYGLTKYGRQLRWWRERGQRTHHHGGMVSGHNFETSVTDGIDDPKSLSWKDPRN